MGTDFSPIIKKYAIHQTLTETGVRSQLLLADNVQAKLNDIKSEEINRIVGKQIDEGRLALSPNNNTVSQVVTVTIHAEGIAERIKNNTLNKFELGYIKYCSEQGYQCVDYNKTNLIQLYADNHTPRGSVSINPDTSFKLFIPLSSSSSFANQGEQPQTPDNKGSRRPSLGGSNEDV